MNKAVLVIDMPKNCAECKLIHLQGIGERICNAVDWPSRPSWCPLRPLPQKTYAEFPDSYKYGYADGRNACLDEITDHIGESTEKFCNDDLYESWMFFDEGETE